MTAPPPSGAGQGESERFAIPFVKALVTTGDRTSFLLQRRAKPGDPYEGHWELPGGRMRHGETAEAALRRELAEETGLRLLHVLRQPEDLWHDRFGRAARSLSALAVVEVVDGPWPYLGLYFAVEAEGTPRPTAEADRHRWITVEEFRREFLAPDASGALATLDRVAMRRILGEGQPSL